MLADAVGIGVDLNYTHAYQIIQLNSVDTNGTSVNYEYKVGMSTVRIMPVIFIWNYAPYVGLMERVTLNSFDADIEGVIRLHLELPKLNKQFRMPIGLGVGVGSNNRFYT